MSSSPFVNGLDLSEHFYHEAVKPLLEKLFPSLIYSAALIGMGSEVLGFDTPQSTDHDWGPRLILFLNETDYQSLRSEIDQRLRQELPSEIHGYSTHFDGHADQTSAMTAWESGPINHKVLILTPTGFFRYVLNFDPMGEIRPIDWVSIPANRLLMMTAGRVFHDGLGQLEPTRSKLRYYPDQVWFYLLAAQWKRIAQEEAFMGRCGQVGDELGSRLVAARLARDLINLCFLMERRYAPYIKWFGSAFAQLACAGTLGPIFEQVLKANGWEERQQHLSAAYQVVAMMHNQLGITPALPTDVSPYYNRPFLVIQADRFVEAIRALIQDEAVRALPENLGSVDQFVDSTDAQRYLERVREIYG